LDASPDPIEKQHTKFGFQSADLAGCSRLREMQSCSGAREAAVLGDSYKSSKLTEFHKYIPKWHQ
jgi:hypothetical protein